jgi:uncharacterized YccA/Bax inhibitor family protein
MENSNIAMKGFEHVQYTGHKHSVMTVDGTMNKLFILTVLVMIGGYVSWNQILPISFSTLLLPIIILTLLIAIFLAFKPLYAKYLAPVYAVLEGLFLGTISLFFEQIFPGIVIEAVLLTLLILLLMNVFYRTGVIKVTEKFKSIMIIAIFSIMGVYLLSFILNLFGSGIPYIHGNGPIGIIFSLVVVVIASLSLLLDFDFIEKQSGKTVKDMEWYGAFAVIVTLVWLYIEVLKLLSKLKSNE